MLDKIIGTGLTFDDVLLVPAKSSVIPSEINIATRLTKEIELNIPIVSAAMDTVTEAELAITLARQGGIGIIHKNMTPEAQAGQVDMVKRSEGIIVTNPITLGPENSVKDALVVMKKYKISGVPIIQKGILVGMLTSRDLRFVNEETLPIKDVMTSEGLVTAREGVKMEEAQRLLNQHRVEKLPVVDAKMRLKGLLTFKDIKKGMDFPCACKDSEGRLRAGAAVGVGNEAMKRVDLLVESNVDVVVIDTAHGHSKNVIDMLVKVKTRHGNLQVMAGNIATAKAAEDLNKATSAVSYAVQKLEERLDIALFQRQGRRSVLTPAGQLLLAEGRAILQTTVRLANKAKEVSTGWEPRISIAVESLQSYPVFFGVLREFLEEHSTIEIDICECVLNGGWEALEVGRVDLIVGSPGPVPLQKGYRAMPMTRVDLVPVIASRHVQADLVGNHDALRAALPKLRRIVTHDTSSVDIKRSEGLSSDGQKFYVQNADQKVEAILAGIGIGHLPRHRIQRHLDSGTLIRLDLEQNDTIENYLAWKISNKGKGLRALSQRLAAVPW